MAVEGMGGYYVLVYDGASSVFSQYLLHTFVLAVSTSTVIIHLYFTSLSNTKRLFNLCIHRTLQIEAFSNWMEKRARFYWIFGLKVNQEILSLFILLKTVVWSNGSASCLGKQNILDKNCIQCIWFCRLLFWMSVTVL